MDQTMTATRGASSILWLLALLALALGILAACACWSWIGGGAR